MRSPFVSQTILRDPVLLPLSLLFFLPSIFLQSVSFLVIQTRRRSLEGDVLVAIRSLIILVVDGKKEPGVAESHLLLFPVLLPLPPPDIPLISLSVDINIPESCVLTTKVSN